MVSQGTLWGSLGTQGWAPWGHTSFSQREPPAQDTKVKSLPPGQLSNKCKNEQVGPHQTKVLGAAKEAVDKMKSQPMEGREDWQISCLVRG